MLTLRRAPCPPCILLSVVMCLPLQRAPVAVGRIPVSSCTEEARSYPDSPGWSPAHRFPTLHDQADLVLAKTITATNRLLLGIASERVTGMPDSLNATSRVQALNSTKQPSTMPNCVERCALRQDQIGRPSVERRGCSHRFRQR